MNRHWLLSFGLIAIVISGGFATFGPGHQAHSRDRVSNGHAEPDLLAAIEAARDDLRPLTDQDLQHARQDVLSAMNTLSGQLAQGGAEHEAGWKAYLMWDDLTAEMEREQPNPVVLRTIHERLRRNNQGLELSAFVNLRSAIYEYANLIAFTSRGNFPAYYQTVLDQLATNWQQYQAEPSFESAHSVGRVVGLLDASHQAPQLVRQVRSHFSHPNVIAWVSEDFLNTALKRPVNDVTPVSEMILGTHQTGTAQTHGWVEFKLEPNQNAAQLVATLTGETVSQNVGHRPLGRKSIYIHSTGYTSVSASKRIMVTHEGIYATPARACCRTQTQIHCIQSPPLLSGLVASQVYSKKQQAEQIASGRAASRIQRRFDEQVDDAVRNNKVGGDIQIRSVLKRLDCPPEETRATSTHDHLEFHVRQANSLQLGAGSQPPARLSGHDFGLTLHESSINNLLESILGGKNMSRDRLLSLVGRRSGDAANDLQSKLGDEDWSILFPSTKPVVFEMRDGAIVFTLTGSRFSRDGQPIPDAMQISATYRPVRTEQGWVFRREGELAVDYVNATELSTRQVAFRSFARDKFSLLFADELAGEGFLLPDAFNVDQTMKLSEIQFQGAWIQLAWDRQSTEAEAATGK